jgi:hypothetical protein
MHIAVGPRARHTPGPRPLRARRVHGAAPLERGSVVPLSRREESIEFREL